MRRRWGGWILAWPMHTAWLSYYYVFKNPYHLHYSDCAGSWCSEQYSDSFVKAWAIEATCRVPVSAVRIFISVRLLRSRCHLHFQSINQFISFSINPLQGVHHMNIEMVKKYIYTSFRSDLYNFQCHTLYKGTTYKIIKYTYASLQNMSNLQLISITYE